MSVPAPIFVELALPPALLENEEVAQVYRWLMADVLAERLVRHTKPGEVNFAALAGEEEPFDIQFPWQDSEEVEGESSVSIFFTQSSSSVLVAVTQADVEAKFPHITVWLPVQKSRKDEYPVETLRTIWEGFQRSEHFHLIQAAHLAPELVLLSCNTCTRFYHLARGKDDIYEHPCARYFREP
jgi:hypothetical protein